MSQSPVIHWFRRDLRLQDNMALHAALATKQPVIPLFVFDPAVLDSPRIGKPRLRFWVNALESLDRSLQQYDTRLLVRQGKPQSIIAELVQETGATALYLNRDYSPYARRRDNAVEDSLDISVNVYDDNLLVVPEAIETSSGTPYTVYTPFMKKWKKKTKPDVSHMTFSADQFYPVHDLNNTGLGAIKKPETIPLPEATEDAARHRLQIFLDQGIHHYDDGRNNLPVNPYADDDYTPGSSYISPYLRAGLLSPRQVYHAARDAYQQTDSQPARQSIETYVNEIIWREFYMHVLYHFPHVLHRDFRDTYESLAWREDESDLQAWKEGRTGYPIVDAPMRQLKATGWMPNRARMVVASFLTKDLLIHWREGDIHFMQHLIDGDPAANNGGWQWAAGTGTDAQPYFRIFNPVSQSEKYATPAYLRHWLPELADVPDKHIHTPWKMDSPPADYPAPIVDHSIARERTLKAFKEARGET